jgi:hypothetical protein
MVLNLQPGIPAFPIASTGAAAGKLDASPVLKHEHPELRDEISYLTLMRDLIGPTHLVH